MWSGSWRKPWWAVFNQQHYLWMKGHDPFVVKTVFSITEHKILFTPSQLPCDSTRDLCQAVMIPSWFNKVETRYIIQPLSHPFTGTLIAVTTLKDCKRERQSSQAPRHYLRKGFVTYLVQSFSSWITPICSGMQSPPMAFLAGEENGKVGLTLWIWGMSWSNSRRKMNQRKQVWDFN